MSQTILLTDSRASGIIFDKRLGTNLIAAVLVVFGYWISEPWSKTLLNIGLFSLSGALTNWLAVYMLFERVPGIYGSGVIPLHFEDFKTGIRQLIMRQFFDRNNLEKFYLLENRLRTNYIWLCKKLQCLKHFFKPCVRNRMNLLQAKIFIKK